jgi:multidrug transporter EmrE-like cation transporter
MKNQTKLLALLMVICEITTQFFLQKGVNKKMSIKNINMVIGLAIGFFINVFYFMMLNLGVDLAVANTLIDGGGAVGIVLLGFLVFKQKLTVKQMVGILLTIFGVILIS